MYSLSIILYSVSGVSPDNTALLQSLLVFWTVKLESVDFLYNSSSDWIVPSPRMNEMHSTVASVEVTLITCLITGG